MNIDMIRDTDNDPGFYVAACSADGSAWHGAALYMSADGGGAYTQIASIAAASTIGYTLEALPSFVSGNIPDELNQLKVQLLTSGTLSSTTFAGMLAGANTCVVGDEIIYFRDATLENDGTYTLTGLLRGRRGSEYAKDDHVSGERFVLISATQTRVPQVTADLNQARLYKCVVSGSSLANATAVPFTNEGVGLMPYSPVKIGGGRNAGGDLTINWIRRTRVSGEWRDNVDVPISEESEAYEVEIWDDITPALKRTITGLTAPTTTYSAADQTTDFGSPQASIGVRVFQLSAVVGRGHAGYGIV